MSTSKAKQQMTGVQYTSPQNAQPQRQAGCARDSRFGDKCAPFARFSLPASKPSQRICKIKASQYDSVGVGRIIIVESP
jgi:hypothetical protein